MRRARHACYTSVNEGGILDTDGVKGTDLGYVKVMGDTYWPQLGPK